MQYGYPVGCIDFCVEDLITAAPPYIDAFSQ